MRATRPAQGAALPLLLLGISGIIQYLFNFLWYVCIFLLVALLYSRIILLFCLFLGIWFSGFMLFLVFFYCACGMSGIVLVFVGYYHVFFGMSGIIDISYYFWYF